MVSSSYRRSKSLAADVARWWNQLKLERGKYLDETSMVAKLVKTLLSDPIILKESVSIENPPQSPSEHRISLVETLQEIIHTMKDSCIDIERSLIDIMGNDLVEPLTPGRAIELIQVEAKQLELLLCAAKNYIKVRNRYNDNLSQENQSQLLKSSINELTEEFRTLQDQIIHTEEILKNVYEELTQQRELADLLEKKQFL